MDYEIVEKEFAVQPAFVCRETVTMKTVGEGLDAGFRAVREHAAATGADVVGPPFVFSPDFGKDSFELIVCLPIAEGAQPGEVVAVEEYGGWAARVRDTRRTVPGRAAGLQGGVRLARGEGAQARRRTA